MDVPSTLLLLAKGGIPPKKGGIPSKKGGTGSTKR